MLHFAMLQTTKYCSRIQVKTHSTMLAIALPQMVGFAKIVRVNSSRKREVIMFNNSNFTAVKKTASMRMGGG